MTKDDKIKLHNIGGRTIQTNEGNLEPKKTKAFTRSVGERLLRLYPDELQDIENLPVPEIDEEPDDAPDDEPESETWADNTVREMKGFLDSLEIKYDAKAAKPVFVALCEAAEGKENALEAITVKDLQGFLAANEVEFETDNNKDRLIELANGLMAE